MRKKSHISLSRYLIDNMDKKELLEHKKAFYIGSILPDCVPSFLTRRHSFDQTFYIVQEQIRYLVEEYDITEGINAKFCRRLGEVTHYIADYFTFPHNVTFDGNMKEHCVYERVLKNELKSYVMSAEAVRERADTIEFLSADDILRFIDKMHKKYLEKLSEVQEDISYIVAICFQVVDAILRLIEVRFNYAEYLNSMPV